MPNELPTRRNVDWDASDIGHKGRRRASIRMLPREALGDRCRTLFPEILLAGVPNDGLLMLGEHAAARVSEAPVVLVWVAALIAEELSRRLDVPRRGLTVVAVPSITTDQRVPTTQVLRDLLCQFDSWSQESKPGAAQVADLLAALTSLVNPA